MIRGLCIAIAIAWAGLAVPAPVFADVECKIVKVRRVINNQIVLVDTKVCHETGSSSGSGASDIASLPPPAGSASCIGGMIDIGLDPDDYCGRGEDEAPPVVTGGLVASALRRITMPASELHIQPPGGRTLVNFETNFFTTNDDPFTRTVRLLGRQVELRIWPTSYTWHFDDGDPITTSSPGARYPDLEITHNYLEKGKYRPTVETTYAAEWRIGGGEWQPVAGTATISGSSIALEAIEARPTLVGHGG